MAGPEEVGRETHPLEREDGVPGTVEYCTSRVMIHGRKWVDGTYQAESAVFRTTISITGMMSSDLETEVIGRLTPPYQELGDQGPTSGVRRRRAGCHDRHTRSQGEGLFPGGLSLRHDLHGRGHKQDLGVGMGWLAERPSGTVWLPYGLMALSEADRAISE